MAVLSYKQGRYLSQAVAPSGMVWILCGMTFSTQERLCSVPVPTTDTQYAIHAAKNAFLLHNFTYRCLITKCNRVNNTKFLALLQKFFLGKLMGDLANPSYDT